MLFWLKKNSLAASKVVKMTTFGAANDENFVKWRHFRFSECDHYPYDEFG